VPVVVTSAGNPSDPVPFRWVLASDAATATTTLRLQRGTLHAIPSAVRLVDASDQVIALAATIFAPGGRPDLCGGSNFAGMTEADLPLSPSTATAFAEDAWPTGYRLEAEVGGMWRPVEVEEVVCPAG
jgi:hypothetical protein